MSSTEPDPGRTRDELLDHVYGRARRLWWQRRVAPVLSATVVLTALVATPVLLRDGGGDRRLETVAGEGDDSTSATTIEETTSTTLLIVPDTTAVTTTAEPRHTTTTRVCRNSHDSRCGPFHWDPAPGPNQPLAMTVTFSPAQPHPGDEVTFNLYVDDPDAPIQRECNYNQIFGDQGPDSGGCAAQPGCVEDEYGPWTTPEPRADRYEKHVTHRYASAGSYRAEFSFESGQSPACLHESPYASKGTGSVTVIVT